VPTVVNKIKNGIKSKTPILSPLSFSSFPPIIPLLFQLYQAVLASNISLSTINYLPLILFLLTDRANPHSFFKVGRERGEGEGGGRNGEGGSRRRRRSGGGRRRRSCTVKEEEGNMRCYLNITNLNPNNYYYTITTSPTTMFSLRLYPTCPSYGPPKI